MNNIWTNFDYDEERISRYFEETDTGNLAGKEDEVLEELAPHHSGFALPHKRLRALF